MRPETLEESRARVGQLLAGKYRLEEVIGSGGMAHVYRATNTAIDRTVAIKILRREQVENPGVVERFLREARTANRVQHPHVVDVTDVGQDSDGSPFLVQEYLEGETLFDYAQRQGGKLSLPELSEIMGPVLSAVAEAHERGVVHRDLKPENVFLAGRRGRRIPKVLDFGISKVQSSEHELTAVGVMMGTPAYMAPELGVSSKDADARTDVWALGVVIFEMLSGKLPFEGESVGEVLLAVATTDAVKLRDVQPDVPERISEIVAKCLRRNPDERYKNAAALAYDLARALEEKAPGTMAAWSVPPPSTVVDVTNPAAATLQSARPDFIDAMPLVAKPAALPEARARSSERMRSAPIAKDAASDRMKAAAEAVAARESSRKMPAAKDATAEPANKSPSGQARISSGRVEKAEQTGVTQPTEKRRRHEAKDDASASGKHRKSRAPKGKESLLQSSNLLTVGAVVMIVLFAILVALRLAG